MLYKVPIGVFQIAAIHKRLHLFTSMIPHTRWGRPQGQQQSTHRQVSDGHGLWTEITSMVHIPYL